MYDMVWFKRDPSGEVAAEILETSGWGIYQKWASELCLRALPLFFFNFIFLWKRVVEGGLRALLNSSNRIPAHSNVASLLVGNCCQLM
jgi:hypothetical protein